MNIVVTSIHKKSTKREVEDYADEIFDSAFLKEFAGLDVRADMKRKFLSGQKVGIGATGGGRNVDIFWELKDDWELKSD